MGKKAQRTALLLGWIALLGYMSYALNFANRKAKEVVCRAIAVEVLDSAEYQIVKASDIKQLLTKSSDSPLGKPLSTINTLALEKKLSKLVAVKDVQVYKTIDGTLRITMLQRKPIVRIFNTKGKSYFIDNEGHILPASTRYTANVLVANGRITESFRVKPNLDITRCMTPDGEPDMVNRIYRFARYVYNHKFWNAQFCQLYVKNSSEIELIPIVGPHIIELGTLDEFPKKLAKLELFYRKALPAVGWNRYSKINLKYSNQIVCTKRQ